MKKLLLVIMLSTIASQATSAVLCQSMRDPNFKAWFEGYSCPSGYYYLKSQ
jgi:hypothetical protein